MYIIAERIRRTIACFWCSTIVRLLLCFALIDPMASNDILSFEDYNIIYYVLHVLQFLVLKTNIFSHFSGEKKERKNKYYDSMYQLPDN